MKRFVLFIYLLSFVIGQQKISHETKLWESVFIFQSHQKMEPSMYMDDVDGFLMNKADKECSGIMDIIEHKTIEKSTLKKSTYLLESTIKTIHDGPHKFPLKRKEPSNYKINYFSSSS